MGIRKLQLVVIAALTLAAPSAQAAGPLVNGELRLGPTPDAPLLPDRSGIDAQTKPLTQLQWEAASGATVSCAIAEEPVVQGFGIYPGDPFHGVFDGGSHYCTAVGLPGLTAPDASWQGFVRARYEQGNLGDARNGVLETIRGPYDKRFSFYLFSGDGPCEYEFLPAARFDWFNPGEGHKIVLDREPLTRVRKLPGQHYANCPGDDDPTTVDAWVSQQVRLRAWDAATGTYSLPVWLLPQAQ